MAGFPDEERGRIAALLGSGLSTRWQTRAYEPAQIAAVVRELAALAPGDVEGRLKVGGFTDKPYVATEEPEIEQACQTCMYYEPHRRWCALPELDLPVEAQWSCIVWRI